ncbi:predicted protein [Plenodomus lingam JN3]|uniref:Predicted protein n=1 Tax=Leptosphaeria maculans (strain JN3 / isolate v23.1.3 / race Av1-4-5-6-7-8) TaxID=985895 RepID=E4ZZ74_LEPMJ|nr:predicted protein [Plenodomus lingam JN3]CBX96669.1 predicted protein [Plenodomus lingam JN3]
MQPSRQAETQAQPQDNKIHLLLTYHIPSHPPKTQNWQIKLERKSGRGTAALRSPVASVVPLTGHRAQGQIIKRQRAPFHAVRCCKMNDPILST